MIFYAIRHKPTGFYMGQFQKMKGFTVEDLTADCLPRLFKKKHHAVAAVRHCKVEGMEVIGMDLKPSTMWQLSQVYISPFMLERATNIAERVMNADTQT